VPNLWRSAWKALLPGERRLAVGVALGTKDSRQRGVGEGKEGSERAQIALLVCREECAPAIPDRAVSTERQQGELRVALSE
jgi:hypothetical protein